MNDDQQRRRNAWWVISNSLCIIALCYWASVLGGVASDFRDVSIVNQIWQETESFAQLPRVTEREVCAFAGRRFRERGLEFDSSQFPLVIAE